MTLVETAYLVAVAGVTLSGFVMNYLAVDAYWATRRPAMIHLTVGFALIVAAAAGTALGAVLSEFAYVRSLLLVNSGFTAVGYGFVVYSLLRYRAGSEFGAELPGFEFMSSRVSKFYP